MDIAVIPRAGPPRAEWQPPEEFPEPSGPGEVPAPTPGPEEPAPLPEPVPPDAPEELPQEG